MNVAVIGTALAGLVIVATCVLVLRRSVPRVRLSMAGAAFTYLLWSAGSIGLLLGMPAPVFWAGVRPLALACISVMQYLARLPVDILKIDRKFIWGLGEHGEHDVLVRSMIRLAAEMGFGVIAEGVETRTQADLLTEYGCRLAQGYLFSRPRPLPELLTGPPSAIRAIPATRSGSAIPAGA